jgi:hypothetical protein
MLSGEHGGTRAMRQAEYLAAVKRLADAALIQAEAVTPCERHRGVLLHNGNGEAEQLAFNLASVWLKSEVGTFIREDLQDAIRSTLDGAAKGGCPECARLRDG